MGHYWDLIPYSDSAGRDWVPGGKGRDLAFSPHRNIILILSSQLLALIEEFVKVNSYLNSISFAQKAKNAVVVFV